MSAAQQPQPASGTDSVVGGATGDRLLALRVSELIALDERCLGVLLRHGFTPLKSPALRRVLAPTVDLGQAAALRGLTERQERELLADLTAVLATSRSAERSEGG